LPTFPTATTAEEKRFKNGAKKVKITARFHEEAKDYDGGSWATREQKTVQARFYSDPPPSKLHSIKGAARLQRMDASTGSCKARLQC
jgi:hypothetical protein